MREWKFEFYDSLASGGLDTVVMNGKVGLESVCVCCESNRLVYKALIYQLRLDEHHLDGVIYI